MGALEAPPLIGQKSSPNPLSAKQRLSKAQWFLAAVGAAASALLIWLAPFLFLKGALLLHLFFATGFLALRGAAFLATLQKPPKPAPSSPYREFPSVALLCPLYREAESVRHLLGALDRLAYPRDKLEILILVEEDDVQTLEALPSLSAPFRLVIVPDGLPRTKPRALNHGLLQTKADLIGVYDAEDRPETDQIQRVAAAFSHGDEALACVQARLNYYNRDDTLITRMFALEYALQFDWFLPGLSRLGLPLPLGGTSNFVRAEALRTVGGWDPYNVTEDADLGMKLGASGYRMVAISSSTFEEATDSPWRWIKQRSRWLKGFLQTWMVHTRSALAWRESLVLHFALGAVFFSAVMNPITWIAFLSWAAFGWQGWSPVFDGGVGEFCLAFFLAGSATHLWFTLAAPLRRGWLDLTTSFLFVPVYWVLQSIAAYKALYEFVLRPYYWDKTEHSAGERCEHA